MGDLSADNWGGRNIHFGVREHAMGAIMNGLALHGGIIPYGATFLTFTDYMRPAMRLAALMELQVIYIFTHDSIGVGEDGPTHQPIEHLCSLRIMPNMTVIRPADVNEAVVAWQAALQHQHGPVCLSLTRHNVPIFDRAKMAPATGLLKGAYILAEAPGGKPDVILMGTGSEVQHLVAACEQLAAQGVMARVVSFPCMEFFNTQPKAYQDEVLPPAVTARLAMEAGVTSCWCRYVGPQGDIIGLDHFGASAPTDVVMEKFGFTAENVIKRALALVGRK
jgi:transketolase